jgi:hypothetical protein
MPDRDCIHPKLNRVYQSLYKQICEGHDSAEELARVALIGFSQGNKFSFHERT